MVIRIKKNHMPTQFTFKDRIYIDSSSYKNTYVPRFLLADLDGDGVNDLVYTKNSRNTGGGGFNETYPNGIGYDGDATKFIVKAQLILSGSGKLQNSTNKITNDPGALMASGLAVGEFNGDGIPDFVIGNYGMDVGLPTPIGHGWNTYVYLSNKASNTWTATQLTPKFTDLYDLYLTHAISVGDLNGDGLDDIYLNARNWGDRIYLSKGDGTFTTKTTFELYGKLDTRTLGVFITDTNSDGKDELIRLVDNEGDRGFPAVGKWLSKTGNLENQIVSNPTNSPTVNYLPEGLFGSKTTMSLEALSFDINGDGQKDLLINQTRAGTDAYMGSKFQVLINDGKGGWKDESYRVEKQSTEGVVDFWYRDITTADYDMDGDLDIFAYEVGQGTYLYENVNGTFTNQTEKVIGKLNPSVNGIYPIDWGNHIELVSIPSKTSKTSNYDGEVQIYTSETIFRRKAPEGKFIAYDIDKNAGTTAKILGAVIGKDGLQNKSYVGIGLSLLDKGMSYSDLGALALTAVGATTNDAVVSTLWKNVIGTVATEANLAPYIKMLTDGMKVGDLVVLAADTSFNTTNINLVGLAQTGIEYLPVV
jgi:hypothetical protein